MLRLNYSVVVAGFIGAQLILCYELLHFTRAIPDVFAISKDRLSNIPKHPQLYFDLIIHHPGFDGTVPDL